MEPPFRPSSLEIHRVHHQHLQVAKDLSLRHPAATWVAVASDVSGMQVVEDPKPQSNSSPCAHKLHRQCLGAGKLDLKINGTACW